MNEPLRQRKPRLVDEKYLAQVRALPCCVCGREGPSDAAHIRMSDAEWGGHYGKRATGMAEKPDDCWAVPLCRPVLTPDSVTMTIKPESPRKVVNIGCHGRQHGGQVGYIKDDDNSIEVRFWKQNGKNPFQIAATLYKKFGTVLTERKRVKWRAKEGRPRPKRKIVSRGFDTTVKRKIPKRKKP